MWEKDPEIKPLDEWYRLCCNKSDGCFMARWNGVRWSGEPYQGEDAQWTADTLKVDAWLKTPLDDGDF